MFSYRQALDYLESLINYEKKSDLTYNKRLFNLDRIRLLLERLGNPHFSLKTVHIAGTKGKGSTAAIITSILADAGYKVGLYTSPHLVSPRERIRICERLIEKEEFSFFIWKIKKIVDGIKEERRTFSPTFFEVYTSCAFAYFYEKKVDVAVIEVGLGGRLDATNVITPLVGVITPVSLDHTKQLGNDLISIAKEKAGIIKPHSTIVISRQERKVLSLLERICRERKAKFYKIGEDIKFNLKKATPAYQVFDVKGIKEDYSSLFIPLAGEHQLWNAATAVGVVELLSFYGFKISCENIFQGIKNVSWPGRIQTIDHTPDVIVDCAHNGASAQYLARFLNSFYKEKKIILVLSVLKNKDIEAIARALCPLANRVIVTKINSPRALPVDEIYSKIKRYCTKDPVKKENLEEALKIAEEMAGKSGVVCITGSVYLVGEVLSFKGIITEK